MNDRANLLDAVLTASRSVPGCALHLPAAKLIRMAESDIPAVVRAGYAFTGPVLELGASSRTGLSPVRASSTARWRNSVGCGAGIDDILRGSRRPPHLRCPENRGKLNSSFAGDED